MIKNCIDQITFSTFGLTSFFSAFLGFSFFSGSFFSFLACSFFTSLMVPLGPKGLKRYNESQTFYTNVMDKEYIGCIYH